MSYTGTLLFSAQTIAGFSSLTGALSRKKHPNPYEGVYAAARPCNGKELGRSLRYTHAAGSGPCEAVGAMVLCARL